MMMSSGELAAIVTAEIELPSRPVSCQAWPSGLTKTPPAEKPAARAPETGVSANATAATKQSEAAALRGERRMTAEVEMRGMDLGPVWAGAGAMWWRVGATRAVTRVVRPG